MHCAMHVQGIKHLLDFTSVLCMRHGVVVAVYTFCMHNWRCRMPSHSGASRKLQSYCAHAQQLNCSGTIGVAWLENVGFAIFLLHDHVFLPEKY